MSYRKGVSVNKKMEEEDCDVGSETLRGENGRRREHNRKPEASLQQGPSNCQFSVFIPFVCVSSLNRSIISLIKA